MELLEKSNPEIIKIFKDTPKEIQYHLESLLDSKYQTRGGLDLDEERELRLLDRLFTYDVCAEIQAQYNLEVPVYVDLDDEDLDSIPNILDGTEWNDVNDWDGFDTGDAVPEARSLALTIDNLELREDQVKVLEDQEEKERQIAFSLMTERNISYAEKIAPLVKEDIEANGVTNQYNIDDFFADLKPYLVKHVKDANPDVQFVSNSEGGGGSDYEYH